LNQIIKKQKADYVKKIFLFSDGWFHDDNLNAVKDLEIPVITFDPEFSSTEFDIEIKGLKFNRTFFRDELNSFIIDLAANNYSDKAKLDFFIKDQLIESRPIDFTEKKFQQIFIEYSFNNTGLYPIEFRLVPDIEGEKNTANNFYPSAVNVLKEKSKILIISDKLTWDVKFLQDALKENQRWHTEFLLKHNTLKFKNRIVILSEKIENTEVIVLINNSDLLLSNDEQELIVNHVKRGGGLLIQGKPVKDLDEIMPSGDAVINRTFSSTIYFTESSNKYESFNFEGSDISNDIPPVKYYYVNPKLQTDILAGINNEERSPAILFNEYEQGKILYFTFLDLWKWLKQLLIVPLLSEPNSPPFGSAPDTVPVL